MTPKALFLYYAAAEMKGLKQRRPSQEELDKYFSECGGPWKKADTTTSWCGIFVTYLLRKAGVDVYWQMSKGIRNVKGSKKKKGAAQVQYFSGAQKEGISFLDIVVRDKSLHHFIAISPPDKDDIFDCIEGNYGRTVAKGGTPLLHWGQNKKNNKKEDNVKYFYRIV